MDVFAFPRDFRISDIILQAVCLFVRVRLPEINGNVFFEALLMLRGLTVRPHPARIFSSWEGVSSTQKAREIPKSLSPKPQAGEI